ncbi:unnamed protein product [Onchocerca flexuosa]|uniref:Ovule protein n=1 Tax=Onchocerca flexuosa TaxID=387005 RepID=A0A183H5F2_9BILA|nr:unnamed protein product [Onchocerca flexuosa]
MWSKSSNIPPMMHQPPPNVIPNSVGMNLSGVDHYQTPSARIQTQQPNVHPHGLMQQQIKVFLLIHLAVSLSVTVLIGVQSPLISYC